MKKLIIILLISTLSISCSTTKYCYNQEGKIIECEENKTDEDESLKDFHIGVLGGIILTILIYETMIK